MQRKSTSGVDEPRYSDPGFDRSRLSERDLPQISRCVSWVRELTGIRPTKEDLIHVSFEVRAA